MKSDGSGRSRRQTAWRPVLARLHLLASLIPVWGICTNGGEGLPLEGLMKFVGTALRNANAEVRSAAGNVTVLVIASEDCSQNCSD